MQTRLNYAKLSPAAFQAMLGFSQSLEESSLGKSLMELLFLRVSQINGCAFCIDMHGYALKQMGESFQRLNSLAFWRDAPCFSERERAALAWAETLTNVASSRAPQDLYLALQAHFNEHEIADLGFAIAAINAWNRIAIGFDQAVALRAA
ncbi:MAG: carboxymuconolactone decarboxylase family protein [Burkholderiales bacterium]|nr:carboxymuconolactone decarboxylase family protein [Burkholderiales bacterium]